MTVEKWIPIAECDGLYEISNFGNVRKKGRLLKGQINRCTQKYNSNYGTCIQRRSKNHEKSVIQMQDGKTIKKWESVIKAGSNLLIDPSSIIKITKGKRKTAGGFEWIYDS